MIDRERKTGGIMQIIITFIYFVSGNPKLLMEPQILFYISYILNAIACFIAGGLLLLLKPLRHATNQKYRIACRTLAVASLIVGAGHLLTVLFDDSSLLEMGIFAFSILVIGASQALLFTFLLIVLFREGYVTKKNIIIHALPFIILTVLYAAACQIWDDPVVYTWQELIAQLTSPPLFIRVLAGVVYLAQLVIYTIIFFRERMIYQQELDHLAHIPERLELRWVTYAFLSALTIGILAFSLCFFITITYEAIITTIFSAYYLIIAICYVNYYYTYETLRSNLIQINKNALSTDNNTNMETLVAGLVQVQSHETDLFSRVQELMEKDKLYLDPAFNRNRLAQMLFTNERYLATAIQEATGLTIQNFIARCRINYACSFLLLSDDRRTIEEIALDSGFSSLRTFNRSFRDVIGMTPSQYRIHHRSFTT